MSGCAITAVALWSIFYKHQYVSLLATPTYALTSYGLLTAGIFATLTALFGCYVVWRDQRSLICCVSIGKASEFSFFYASLFKINFFFYLSLIISFSQKSICINSKSNEFRLIFNKFSKFRLILTKFDLKSVINQFCNKPFNVHNKSLYL